MFNKNEADILPEIIRAALDHVDILYMADDGSTDASWDIMQTFKKTYPQIGHIQQKPNRNDPGQRQSLLTAIRNHHRPENTWVQIIESDIMILDTDIRKSIKKYAVDDIALSWQALNAVRPQNTWKQVDTYPHWGKPIKDLMYSAHRMEHMLYTFRPLEKLNYGGAWRPWPAGFSHYIKGDVKVDWRYEDSPLLAHFGYRGPTHFYQKYKHMGNHHRKYPSWKLKNPNTVEKTVSFFNGEWNRHLFLLSRKGWIGWRKGKKESRK